MFYGCKIEQADIAKVYTQNHAEPEHSKAAFYRSHPQIANFDQFFQYFLFESRILVYGAGMAEFYGISHAESQPEASNFSNADDAQ